MIAYEIHTHRDGQWKMDSVFDDRNMAMHEARKADESNRYAGIRLIEETYDESTGKTATRILFRGGWTNRQANARRAGENRRPAPYRPPPKSGSAPVRTSKPPAAPGKRNLAVPVLVTLIVVAAGLMGLLLLARIKAGG